MSTPTRVHVLHGSLPYPDRCTRDSRGARVRGPGYPGTPHGMPRDEACRGGASSHGQGTRPWRAVREGVWIALGSNDQGMALQAIPPHGSRIP